MKFGDYPKAGSLDGVSGFRSYVQSLGLDMPCDDIVSGGPNSPLGSPLEFDGMKIGHRLAVQPMEGWDCRDRRPAVGEHQAALAPVRPKRRQADLGRRGLRGAARWPRQSEAARHGRAQPEAISPICASIVIDAHKEATGGDDDLVIGLQLTHSGRFCKPNDNTKFESIIAYHHPLLDKKFGYPADRPVISDDEIKRLVEDLCDRGQACRGMRFRFRRRQALPRLSRPRIPERGRSAGTLRRQSGKPHPLSARRSSKASAPRRRGCASACGFSAVDTAPFKPDPERFTARRARSRRAGDGHAAVPLRLRRRSRRSAAHRSDRAQGVVSKFCAGSTSASSTSPRAAPITTRITSAPRFIRHPTAIIRRRILSSA